MNCGLLARDWLRLPVLALLAVASSCDIFAPGAAKPVTITLPFCEPFPIGLTWAAVKNGNSDWVYLTPTDGTVSFTATAALTIAYGNSRDARVYSATAEELRDISCFRRTPDTKFLDGGVNGVAADDQVLASIGATNFSPTQSFTVFVPDGPLELVARTENKNTRLPQRIIVRHGVDLPAGSGLPTLDFASPEALPFDFANITVNSGGSSAIFSNVFWPPGNRHELFGNPLGPLPTRYYAVPSSLLGPDDYHTFEVRDFTAINQRELWYYYLRPRDAQVTLGPGASTPSGSVITSSPCTLLRASMPAQPEYSSFVIARFQVDYSPTDANVLEIGVTSNFLGQLPSTWTVDVPDLARPDGSCMLRPNASSWQLFVTPQDGRLALHLGGKGRDGEVRRWSIGWWPLQ